ncbi:hypothetical protein F4780DRAFT_750839 [Xylariomycetidae sp. FL0641]|nr:hypothetical protein F4780DRAFT_750839 [Xylariomycetidae sp. FL0641]
MRTGKTKLPRGRSVLVAVKRRDNSTALLIPVPVSRAHSRSSVMSHSTSILRRFHLNSTFSSQLSSRLRSSAWIRDLHDQPDVQGISHARGMLHKVKATSLHCQQIPQESKMHAVTFVLFQIESTVVGEEIVPVISSHLPRSLSLLTSPSLT